MKAMTQKKADKTKHANKYGEFCVFCRVRAKAEKQHQSKSSFSAPTTNFSKPLEFQQQKHLLLVCTLATSCLKTITIQYITSRAGERMNQASVSPGPVRQRRLLACARD